MLTAEMIQELISGLVNIFETNTEMRKINNS